LIDIMATCVDLGGGSYPKELHGERIQAMEGVSLVPLLKGEAIERGRPLFWKHEGNRAVRDGDWKLVAKHAGEWELYDMAADRTEMHDLASQQPDRVKAMAGQWDAWAKRVGMMPWPIGGGKGGKKKGK
jgi:arylsulfatase